MSIARSGDRQMSGLAQLGGPVACIGLAIVLVGRNRSRPDRRSRLCRARHRARRDRGCAEPAGPRARRGVRRARRRRRARGSLPRSRRGSTRCSRSRACRCGSACTSAARARSSSCRSTSSSSARRSSSRGSSSRATRRVRELRLATVAARGVHRLDRALARLEQGRERGRDPAARVLHPVHACSRSPSRGCRGAASACGRCTP